MRATNEQNSKLVQHELYWEIIRGRRTSKGNRWLTHLWPNQEEQKLLFTPVYAYLNYIGPGDTAGQHYHEEKKEIFCPLGDLELLLVNTKKKTTEVVKMTIGSKEEYRMYYIPPLVPHAVRNTTSSFQSLVVFTNLQDIYGKTINYQV